MATRLSGTRVYNPRLNPICPQTTFRRGCVVESTGAKGSHPYIWLGLFTLGGGAVYYHIQSKTSKISDKTVENDKNAPKGKESKPIPESKKEEDRLDKGKNIDYQAVYNDIAALLDSNPEYDDGSYGPVLLRLAWHSSGTYNKEDGTGGSNGGTMRFRAEATHSANNGLEIARNLLESKIKPKYPDISYGDLYTLGGVVAVQELGGPTIKWRPGRQDLGENKCTPDGRLPDGSRTADHVRDIFYRMGFNDQEIVALTGAHVLGRCHLERSGFTGPWQEAPTFFSNEYFKVIASREWVKKELPHGLWQWVDKANPDVMMLPIEITMYNDKKFRPYFDLYAKDSDKFFEDFAKAFKKLIELGVPFTGKEKEYEFKRVNQ
ncbi:putative cytochrome c peroxidase Ccp1 [Rhizopus microsporus ATCC 52813]|uniref:Peroxidase n=1 Tax=Rhizopus microsporus ATCC 52813 TaxID=1340429 RepID=A0A2G4T2F5_RHIZD|nr:putative cytochrome c peroxidase Ccp1 [Rhizopus microsporus ATCC 52813]PHZ14846.1 putative cytochrome c peroxidase Ccp1 [Rhizopus microsporus ATCC 52813]